MKRDSCSFPLPTIRVPVVEFGMIWQPVQGQRLKMNLLGRVCKSLWASLLGQNCVPAEMWACLWKCHLLVGCFLTLMPSKTCHLMIARCGLLLPVCRSFCPVVEGWGNAQHADERLYYSTCYGERLSAGKRNCFHGHHPFTSGTVQFCPKFLLVVTVRNGPCGFFF